MSALLGLVKTKVLVRGGGGGGKFAEETEIVTEITNSAKKFKRECVKHGADEILLLSCAYSGVQDFKYIGHQSETLNVSA